MAKPQPIIPPDVEARLKALVTRRTDSQGVDGISRNANYSRVPAPAKEEQGSHPDLRGPSGSRVGEKKAESPKGDRELQQPSAPTKTEGSVHQALVPAPANNPFLTGDHILKAIMDKFVELREQQKVGAWKQLQSDLMRAAPFIVPHIIPLKDVIQIAADIEKEIKGSTAQVGRSNEELLADFLNGGDSIPIDNSKISSIVGARDGESPTAILP